MKIILIILISIFGYQSLTSADDIRDFEIEGMSVGDSALKYFNEKELKNKDDVFYYKSKTNKLFKFQTKSYRTYEKPKKFLVYENIEFHLKKDDPNFIIESIGGILYFRNDLEGCIKKKNQIVSEMSSTFKDTKKDVLDLEPWLDLDPSGDTKTAHVYFSFKSGSYIEVSCYDWSDKITKEKKWQDHLKVILASSDYDTLFGDE